MIELSLPEMIHITNTDSVAEGIVLPRHAACPTKMMHPVWKLVNSWNSVQGSTVDIIPPGFKVIIDFRQSITGRSSLNAHRLDLRDQYDGNISRETRSATDPF